jgi:hypothetical protein
MQSLKKYIIQLRTDPAFDVIDTTTGQVVSVWNTAEAAEIDAATRVFLDLRDARRAAKEAAPKSDNGHRQICHCEDCGNPVSMSG